jgi:hypothetical protein
MINVYKSLFQAPTTTVFVKENSEVLQVGGPFDKIIIIMILFS